MQSAAQQLRLSSSLGVLFVLLPALLAALPTSLGPYQFDPDPLAAASSWALFALLPAAALSLLQPTRFPRAAWLAFAPLLAAALALATGLLHEHFEATRKAALLCSSAAAFALALGCDAPARRLFMRALVALTVLAALPMLFTGDLYGSLGNSGLLAQLCLPGAALGALLALDASQARIWRLLGGAALLSSLVQLGLAPVLASSLALGAGLLVCGSVVLRGSPRALRLGLVGCALLALAAPWLGGALKSMDDKRAEMGASPLVLEDAAGLEVRLLLWKSSGKLLADHPWLGCGLGQFVREYPLYRDPAEIELSSHGHRLANETQVEHLHNDLLQAAAEFGIPAALALLVLAIAAVRQALRPSAERELAGLAAALCAVLVNGLAHAPLLEHPAVAPIGAALLGLQLARGARLDSSLWPARALAALCLAVGLGLAPRAWDLVRHGREQAQAVAFALHQDVQAYLTAQSKLVEQHPESVSAWATAARSARAAQQNELALQRWQAARALRPYDLEALINIGVLEARAGRPQLAQPVFALAALLDPGHTSALQNLALVSCDLGALVDARLPLDHLQAANRLTPEFLNGAVRAQLLRGRLEAAALFLERFDPELGRGPAELTASGEWFSARAKLAERREGSGELVAALEVQAQWRWAREALARQDYPSAVRSYRQALLRWGRWQGELTNDALALELAAALLLDQRPADARRELPAEPPLQAPDGIVPAARAALQQAGWLFEPAAR